MFDAAMENVADQAAGLRHLFNAQSLGVLPVAGSCRLAELLARALASRSRVVVLDEHGTALANAFQKTARHELADLLSGQREFQDVAVPINDKLSLLAAQKGLQQFLQYAYENSLTGESLFAGFMGLSRPFRWLLVNAVKLQSAAALVGGQGDLLFVITDTAQGIKNAYAEIKQAALDIPDMQLRIVVESDSDIQAHRAFRSLAQTTERFFRVQPRYALRLPQKWKVNTTTAELVRVAMSSWNLAEYVQTDENKHFSVK